MICAKIGPLTNRSDRDAPVFVEDLGAGDVRRHQVGRELDALEAEIQDLGERLDQQRLRQSRHAGDQAVAAREQRDQDLIDDLVLADDHLAQLGENPLRGLQRPGPPVPSSAASSVVDIWSAPRRSNPPRAQCVSV